MSVLSSPKDVPRIHTQVSCARCLPLPDAATGNFFLRKREIKQTVQLLLRGACRGCALKVYPRVQPHNPKLLLSFLRTRREVEPMCTILLSQRSKRRNDFVTTRHGGNCMGNKLNANTCNLGAFEKCQGLHSTLNDTQRIQRDFLRLSQNL